MLQLAFQYVTGSPAGPGGVHNLSYGQLLLEVLGRGYQVREFVYTFACEGDMRAAGSSLNRVSPGRASRRMGALCR